MCEIYSCMSIFFLGLEENKKKIKKIKHVCSCVSISCMKWFIFSFFVISFIILRNISGFNTVISKLKENYDRRIVQRCNLENFMGPTGSTNYLSNV